MLQFLREEIRKPPDAKLQRAKRQSRASTSNSNQNEIDHTTIAQLIVQAAKTILLAQRCVALCHSLQCGMD
jgi:hypothetical protein